MRIVHINVHYQDGLGYQDYYLGKEMQKMGHDVHFITSDRHFDFPNYEKTVQHIIGPKYQGVGIFMNEYGVPIHRLPIIEWLKQATSRIWLKGFKQKLFELKPDLIIVHGIFSFQAVRLAYWTKHFNCPIVYDDHTTINLIRTDTFSNFIFFIFRLLFAEKITRSATKLVGISATCIDVMRDSFGIEGEKVEMIPLGTDTNLFKQDALLRKNYRTQTLNIQDDDTIVVLYTGKIYEDKSVHLIMEALNDNNVNAGKKILIQIVGDIADSYRDTLDNSIKNSIYPVVYQKAVPIKDLIAIYNAADIAVWPNHLTNSTIDASACGCPIICSTYMPERVTYNNGLLVDGGSLESLKTALKTLISDKTLRENMGQNGIEYVEKELSWKAIAEKFILKC
jgi:glycosyltransferase involved in cell wall biosynthesis